MNTKIIPFTLILMLFLSPAALLVNAQDNETEPSPGINGTIPIPPLDGNTTLTNTTLPETNSTSTDVNGTDTDGEPVDPIILALIREQAQNREQEMFQLFGNGTYSPDVMNGLMQAQQMMEQAMNYEGNNSHTAAQYYLRALKQHRNTLRKYLNENPGALDEFEEDVNGTATDDVNGTVTETQLSAAQTRLIEEFEESFGNRVAAMIRNVDDLSDEMDPQDAFKAQQALTKAEEKLLRIQERISSGQYEGVLDDLENATDTLDDDFNETEPVTAQLLKTMNQMEAKIQKMEQKALKKAAKGQSTAEENALLAELRGNKDHTKNDYKENKGNSGNNGNNGNSGNNGKPDKDKKDKKVKDK